MRMKPSVRIVLVSVKQDIAQAFHSLVEKGFFERVVNHEILDSSRTGKKKTFSEIKVAAEGKKEEVKKRKETKHQTKLKLREKKAAKSSVK